MDNVQKINYCIHCKVFYLGLSDLLGQTPQLGRSLFLTVRAPFGILDDHIWHGTSTAKFSGLCGHSFGHRLRILA
jgi:hypothetical protein